MNRPPTCRANRHAPPSAALPVGQWFLQTFRQMLSYEPCGKPATHLAYWETKPLCAEHAEQLRVALRSDNSLGNVLAGGRARTEEEIERMVRPIGDPSS